MINPKSQGCTIIVDELNAEYHSIDDFGLYVANNDYIGTPELYTNYIQVPGANKLLDVSQALTGRRTYKSRPISIEFGRLHPKANWDVEISALRNKIDGRVIRVIFDNDENYYWTGRCQITNFDRVMTLGTFKLEIPQADPFKYRVYSNLDPWLWDPFDFESDSIPDDPIINVSGTETIKIPTGTMYTVPKFTVNRMDSQLILTVNGRSYQMTRGENYFPALMVNGDEEVTLVFTGQGQVVIEYRGGSL